MYRGFVKLHRKMLDWQWFTDPNTAHLFVYILIKANKFSKHWNGVSIPSGSFATSYGHISEETGLSVQQVRTSLKKLERSNDISVKSTNRFTVISVINYTKYQEFEGVGNKQITNEQQTDNKQITNEQQTDNKRVTTTNKDNNDKKDKNINTSAQSNVVAHSLEAEFPRIPLEDGSDWVISKYLYEGLVKTYPKIDVLSELNKMRMWSLSNPSKKKTKRGVTRFVNNWLSKAQQDYDQQQMKLQAKPSWMHDAVLPEYMTQDQQDLQQQNKLSKEQEEQLRKEIEEIQKGLV